MTRKCFTVPSNHSRKTAHSTPSFQNSNKKPAPCTKTMYLHAHTLRHTPTARSIPHHIKKKHALHETITRNTHTLKKQSLSSHTSLSHQSIAAVYRISLSHQPITSAYRISLSHQPIASAYRISLSHRPIASAYRIGLSHRPIASAYRIGLSHQPITPAYHTSLSHQPIAM